MSRGRRAAAGLLLGLIAGLALLGGPLHRWLWRSGPSALAIARPSRPTVLFVVLDNVRADRLALCGHSRPTSAALEALVAEGASFTCDARAPGDWTLPSHASLFTGAPVWEHGAHSLPEGGVALGRSTSETVRPLDTALPTLAERFAAQGYQTAAVSGNPVLGGASGLLRGFQHSLVADHFAKLYGSRLRTGVDALLRAELDPRAPLFLFVNIADAHQPWLEVPRRVRWARARERLSLHPTDPEGPWQRFYKGQFSRVGRAAFLSAYSDSYDYAVYRADRTLGWVLEMLEQRGWLGPDSRIVVTSDHGELIGEHGLIDHGHYLYDQNQRVPVIYLDRAAPVTLPGGPLSGLVVHGLVREGRLPDPLPEVAAMAWPHLQRFAWSEGAAYGATSVARWTADGQQLWMDSDGEPPPEALADLVAQAQRSAARAVEVDPAVAAMLQAAGYLEEEEEEEIEQLPEERE